MKKVQAAGATYIAAGVITMAWQAGRGYYLYLVSKRYYSSCPVVRRWYLFVKWLLLSRLNSGGSVHCCPSLLSYRKLPVPSFPH